MVQSFIDRYDRWVIESQEEFRKGILMQGACEGVKKHLKVSKYWRELMIEVNKLWW